jgi:hypothetical protein
MRELSVSHFDLGLALTYWFQYYHLDAVSVNSVVRFRLDIPKGRSAPFHG